MTVKKTPVRKTTVKGKTSLTAKPIKVNKTNPNSKFTKKSELEREEIKCLISISLRKSHSVSTMIKELKERNFSCVKSNRLHLYQGCSQRMAWSNVGELRNSRRFTICKAWIWWKNALVANAWQVNEPRRKEDALNVKAVGVWLKKPKQLRHTATSK